MAEMGTPCGSSHLESSTGHWSAGVVKRALGWAAGSLDSGVQSLPFHEIRCAGGLSVIDSHHTSLSSVRAQLVKSAFLTVVAMALGFDDIDVPGATPKNPFSGLIA